MSIKTVGMTATMLLSGIMAFVLPDTVNAGEKIVKPWVTGYLPGDWQHGNGTIGILNTDDWNTLTHVVHFAAGLKDDGSLNYDFGSLDKLSAVKRQKAIELAHNNNVPILFSVNAWVDPNWVESSGTPKPGVTEYSPGYKVILADTTKRTKLIDGLITVLKEGYDGLDIDLEPTRTGENYEIFISELQARMKAVTRADSGQKMMLERPLLTVAAIGSDNSAQMLATIQDKIDQINIMTYDAVTSEGCQTWHDSALYTPAGTNVLSVDKMVNAFTSAGIPAHKLGIGINLELRIWQGGVFSGSTDGTLKPLQQWASGGCAASANKPKNAYDYMTQRDSFSNLMDSTYKCIPNTTYSCAYSPSRYKWDNAARMPYLSINNDGREYDMFISYNDPRSVSEKVNYAKNKALGGIMIWELGRECLTTGWGGNLDECVPGQAGKYRPIMKAIRQTLRTGTGKFRPLPVQP